MNETIFFARGVISEGLDEYRFPVLGYFSSYNGAAQAIVARLADMQIPRETARYSAMGPEGNAKAVAKVTNMDDDTEFFIEEYELDKIWEG